MTFLGGACESGVTQFGGLQRSLRTPFQEVSALHAVSMTRKQRVACNYTVSYTTIKFMILRHVSPNIRMKKCLYTLI